MQRFEPKAATNYRSGSGRVILGSSPAVGRRRLTPMAAATLILSLAFAVLGWAVPAAAQEEVQWLDLTLDEALAKAGEENTMVMVDVWASHCHSCGQLSIDVWQTAQGMELAEGLIPIKIDSTSPEGRAMSARYPITGLPAIIFLLPDGGELGRVEGYTDRGAFIREVEPLAKGIDPLPALEVKHQENPADLETMAVLLETYLSRRREAEADSMYNRILRVDPGNRRRQAEKAVLKMAKFEEHFHGDMAKSGEYWKYLVENYPDASSVVAGVMGVQKCWTTTGKRDAWLDWICEVLRDNPTSYTLQRTAATTGLRNGYRHLCLAEAARAAASTGRGNTAYLDSIAVILGQP